MPEDGFRPMHRPLLSRLLLALVLLLSATIGVWAVYLRPPEQSAPDPPADPAFLDPSLEASHAEVERTCSACHGYPPPEIFPKVDWPREVTRGFGFIRASKSKEPVPSIARVTNYYQNRAPETLPLLEQSKPGTPFGVQFERKGYRDENIPLVPAIANVRFVHLTDKTRLDVVACDMVSGKVMLLKPYEPSARPRIIDQTISNPAHAEVVDLDRDGINDLIVANLGIAYPSEDRLGSVVWLRGQSDGNFKKFTLADKLCRVTDVQAADFDGDGDLDLVVAEFGREVNGSILWLENRTKDRDTPVFVPSTLEARPGASHVPVADLNGDGRPDFVAMISQEHETVIAFVNQGNRQFDKQVIYQAPHPGFGSTGIQLVDLDHDGDLDVLMTNGDTLDADLLRPYHGIQWLENTGTYPFRYHHLTSMYGVSRAVAADFDGDGDLDIVATSFMPGPFYRELCHELNLDAVIVLEQTRPGQFVRHSLETDTCDHASCDVGDFDGDGKLDFVTGNTFLTNMRGSKPQIPDRDWIIIERNLGKAK
jgi:hypothetical protein